MIFAIAARLHSLPVNRPKLIFISNLFPDTQEPYRGLDNAAVLHHLAVLWDIRVLAARPTLPFCKKVRTPRTCDAMWQPRYITAPYLPKIGSRVNHTLMARALREPVRALRREFAFDAVLSAWLYPDSCAVAQLARELGFVFVAIAQGSDVHQYLRHPVRRRIIQESMPQATAIITRSADLAQRLAEAGLNPAKLHPIYNGLDFTNFAPGNRHAARRELGLPESAPLVVFVGNFYPIKNPLLLIEAHATLCAQSGMRECRLVMIGGGPLESRARQLANQLGFGAQVLFAGRQDASSVAQHLRAADVLCLPSDNEGVPNVILEAFACGCPVVASRVGGIPEVHTGDFLGRLVPPRDHAALAAALGEVLRTPPTPEPIVAHARQFTWERTTAAYDRLLREAVA